MFSPGVMTPSHSMTRVFGGRTVVLTGGASGIGRALARLLVGAGATVHVLDVNADALAAMVREHSGPGVIHPFILDVRDRDAYASVIGEILRLSKTIDFLFNNAGVTLLGEAQTIPFERWKWLLDVNLMGVIHGTHLVYPLMIAQGSGHIINTASVAGATGYATAAAYATSKAAILEFSRSLRAEAKGYGVRVSVACPGYVNSGIFTQDCIIGADIEAMTRDLLVKMMTPEEAASHLLKGVVGRKNTIVFPFSARFLWWLAKWAPTLLIPLHRRLLRVFQRQ